MAQARLEALLEDSEVKVKKLGMLDAQVSLLTSQLEAQTMMAEAVEKGAKLSDAAAQISQAENNSLRDECKKAQSTAAADQDQIADLSTRLRVCCLPVNQLCHACLQDTLLGRHSLKLRLCEGSRRGLYICWGPAAFIPIGSSSRPSLYAGGLLHSCKWAAIVGPLYICWGLAAFLQIGSNSIPG